jgi:Flp pilus assembly protein TadG
MVQRRRQRDHEKGSALVEFALSAVTILLVIFLIIDVGRALYAYNWISNSARQATRFAMVRGTTCDPLLASYCAAASQPRGAQSSDISNYVSALEVGVDPGSVTVNSHCYVGANVASNPPCAAPGWVQVQVKYNFHFLSPFFGPLSWTMQSTSERAIQQ